MSRIRYMRNGSRALSTRGTNLIRICSSGVLGFRLRGLDLFTTFRFQKQAGIQGSVLTYITIADAMVNHTKLIMTDH